MRRPLQLLRSFLSYTEVDIYENVKKTAWTATFFTLLVLGYSTAKPGQQEEFVPISEYNEKYSGQDEDFVPVTEYNETYSDPEQEFIPIQECNDRMAEYIKSLQKEK